MIERIEDAVIAIFGVFGSIAVLDTLLLLLLMRIRVLNRNIDRRQREKQRRKDKQKDDLFWSIKGQEELYRDFGNAAPASREVDSRQFARDLNGRRGGRNPHHRLSHGPRNL